jgi:hypothetical protein
MAFGPQASAADYRCQNHPDREGLGICVRCRRVMCAECATKIDRMNFCTTCLATLAAGPRQRTQEAERSASSPALGIFLLVVGYFALTGLFVGLGLLIASLRPGL